MMIAVDVYVPYLGSTYDFNLDEGTPISSLITEMMATICAKERWPIPASAKNLALFSPAKMQMLTPAASLCQEGIKTGQDLILC